MTRTLTLPSTEPSDHDQRAAFHRALALAEHFALAAWTLAGSPSAPTPEDRAAAAAGDYEAQMQVAAAEFAANEELSSSELKQVEEEVNDVWQLLEGRGTRESLAEHDLFKLAEWVARPDPDYGAMSEAEALSRFAEWHPAYATRVRPQDFGAAVESIRAGVKVAEHLAVLLHKAGIRPKPTERDVEAVRKSYARWRVNH
jgi:hypothetical protein